MTTIRVLDLRSLWNQPTSIEEKYDQALLAVCLQGLVNRDKPRLVLYGLEYGGWAKFSPPADFDGNIDRYVLNCSTKEGRWLAEADFKPSGSLELLIEEYRDLIQGVAVWDPGLPATANVATTAAGVEDLLPVRFSLEPYPSGRESWYRTLVERLQLPVVRSFVGMFTGEDQIPDTSLPSTGSAKCDAYLWAKHVYLDSGLCRPDLLAYVEDAWAMKHPEHYKSWLAMRDYFVSERGFLVDLSVWDDETPVDDPGQPLGADRRALDAILESAFARTRGEAPIRVFGFTPWAEKYTDHPGAGGKHGAVETEWMLTKVVTPYHGHMVVDIYQGFTANLSLYRHAPPIDRLSQRRPAVPVAESLSMTPGESGTGSSAGGALEQPAGRSAAISAGSVSDEGKPRLNVLFYMGDYCDIGAVYNILPIAWDDPARGKMPLGWSFTPAMAELLPDLFRWMYESKTPNDHFMLGPGLYGYNMPNNLPQNPVYQANLRLAKEWCERLDIDVTGFFIGYEPPTQETLALYKEATPVGVLTNHWRSRDSQTSPPHLGMYDLCVPGHTPEQMRDKFIAHVKAVYPPDRREGLREGFVAFRCIWVEPSLVYAAVELVKESLFDWTVHVADPREFFASFRASGERRGTS